MRKGLSLPNSSLTAFFLTLLLSARALNDPLQFHEPGMHLVACPVGSSNRGREFACKSSVVKIENWLISKSTIWQWHWKRLLWEQFVRKNR